jgi:carbon-monoxide dehydrogenase large subunit
MTAHPHWRPRVEDDALVRGRGRFVDDAPQPDQCHAVFVRSPHAAARIRGIEIADAMKMPGVLAVLTGADMVAAAIGGITRVAPQQGRGGKPLVVPKRPALAPEQVRHVGEPVALVVAETLLAAQDAAEQVTVEYEPLPAVVELREAIKPGAPQVWPEAPGNIALDWPGPVAEAANAREVAEVIARAPLVARVSVTQQRLIVASLEPRGATASYDAARDRYTLRACSQGAGPLRDQLCGAMGLRPEQLRVISEDVGGAFGMKTPAYPEYAALLVAARRLGRPVHWMSTRAEAFLSDNQARDSIGEAELAMDAGGRFLAMRARQIQNMGPYANAAHLSTNNFARCFPGVYAIPRLDISVLCVFTNTTAVGPYRGAGRPEACYLIERVVEEAARVAGLDPIEIRRRNFIPSSAMPYKTPIGTTYDSGEFEAILDKALQLADYAGFARRRAASERRGRRRGIGISCFLEHAGALPREGAALAFPGGNELVLALNAQNTGQSHATVFPRIVAARLGIEAERVKVRYGDTDLGVAGNPTVGSRSAQAVGHALVEAVDAVIRKGKAAAAAALEAAEADIVYRGGAFEVAGTDRRIGLFELAERTKALVAEGRLSETLGSNVVAETPTSFPNGCHIAEVEIDPDTGRVEVVAYCAVDDCGNVLDHTIVEGQVQGGLAQGLGQALYEQALYDAQGQLLTGSFMDYFMPRADQVPEVKGDVHPVPARTNPLGTKGVGEAGTIASLAAIMNAIAHALPGTRLEMPATPEKVWRACQQVRGTK